VRASAANSASKAKSSGRSGYMGAEKRPNFPRGQVLEAGIPVGKVFQAATRLMAAGNIGLAAQLASRVASKRQGWQRAKAYARTKASGMAPNSVIPIKGRVGSKAYPKPNKGAR
jgi:hypothetical protein